VGKRGRCRSRENRNGELIVLNYGRTIALSTDPIEKKPLYHFHPGSHILSLGPNSCNLSCFFCQNYSISQYENDTVYTNPDSIREIILQNPGLSKQVAFTYTEPITWYEFIIDFASVCPEIEIVMVSNGYIDPGPLEALLPIVAAMNIDLKSIRDDFYRQHCGGSLEPVLDTISRANYSGVHIEVTNLLIPGLNDSPNEIRELASFVSSVNKDIPLHISAYHPAYKSTIARTSDTLLHKACDMAKSHLNYVYAGNSFLPEYNDTHCPGCGTTLVHRSSLMSKTGSGQIIDGKCARCSTHIYGRFE
jgi:pyruvate formate lyase activating enzyme